MNLELVHLLCPSISKKKLAEALKGGGHPGPPTSQLKGAREALRVANGHRATAK